jgi:hypothetical protein
VSLELIIESNEKSGSKGMVFMSYLGHILNWIKQLNPEIVKAWGPILVGLAAILVSSIINIILILVQRGQNKRQNEFNVRQIALSKSEEERDEILKRLNMFYGPFIELRTQSKLLYEKFEHELGKYENLRNLRVRSCLLMFRTRILILGF